MSCAPTEALVSFSEPGFLTWEEEENNPLLYHLAKMTRAQGTLSPGLSLLYTPSNHDS